MKTFRLLAFVASLCFLGAILASVALSGCATASRPGTVTSSEQLWAQGVEDTISVGLVPVLAHNPGYVAAAKATANALNLFTGDTLTPDDVTAFLAKTSLTPDEQKTAAGLVNAAWGVFQRHYAQQFGAAVRPDVKLFLGAVANGVLNAAAAVPPASQPAAA